MWLFVGLGNPGDKYANNRHNIGFMAVDAIVRRHNFSAWRAQKKFKAEISEGTLGGEKVLALKPQTYMNLSGEAVQSAMAFYKIKPDRIVVFHDELDLAPGKIRTKQGGGAAGHNGLRSIDQHIGKNYHRARLGIGHPGDKNRVHGYVLNDFAKADHDWLDKMMDGIAENAALIAEGDMPSFMSKVAQAINPPKPKKDKPAKDGEKTGASGKS